MKLKFFNKGFTVIELMIIIVIIGILAAIGISAYVSMINRKNLELITNAVNSKIELSKSMAIRENENIYTSFQSGNTWCIGLSDIGACNCNTMNSCQIAENGNVREFVLKSTDFGANSTLALTGFTSGGTLIFDSMLGIFTGVGVIDISLSGNGSKITVSEPIIKICSNNIIEYPDC